MFALGATSQVGTLVAISVFYMPGCDGVTVKSVNNDFKVLVRTNKHVVGFSIEDDCLVIFKDHLVGKRTRSSGLGAGEKACIWFPDIAALHFDDVGIHNQICLAVRDRRIRIEMSQYRFVGGFYHKAIA